MAFQTLLLRKKVIIRSYVCRAALMRSAMESCDPGASNGGSNVKIQYFGADMAAFEVTEWPRIANLGRSI